MAFNKIRRIYIPGFGHIRFVRDEGTGDFRGNVHMTTNLSAIHFRNGKPIARKDLGSGVVTIGFVNLLVATATSATSVQPLLNKYSFMDSGTGTVADAATDTALGTAAGPARVSATVTTTNATSGTPTGKIQWVGTITYTGSLAISEWGLFDSAGTGTPPSGGNLLDRRKFTAWNVVNTDSIQFTYVLSLPAGS